MTLDEVIRRERHAMRQTTGERSEEHRQMAEWLREARGADMAAKWYTEKIGKMARELHDAYDENETLRGLVLDMWEWRLGLPLRRVKEMRARIRDVGIEVDDE